ncbi:MAG TPA: DUF6580 family putative transport protein [Candidatus Kapabacteria bacterium]|jgi:hypothetical protein
MNSKNNQLLLAGLLVVVAMGTRVLFNALHIYNFSAVMAVALFSGAYLGSKRLGFLIPLVAMLASDLIIGVYDWKLMAIVDGAFVVAIALGMFYAKKPSLLRWISVLLGSSTMFFIVTNFAVWIFGDGSFYPYTFSGLVDCYTMGLPFYRDRLIGDIAWSAALFGSYELLKLRAPKPAMVP